MCCFCSDITDEQPPSAVSVAVLPMNNQLMHCPWCRRHARTSGTPKHICLSVSRSSMQQCTLVTRNSNSTTPASWSTGKRKLWTRSCALTRRSSPRSKLKCYSLFVYIPCININASLDVLQTVYLIVASSAVWWLYANLLLKCPCMHVCRNAEVSNTFKVDLHALHVDEAIYEVERTIKALSPFKCK